MMYAYSQGTPDGSIATTIEEVESVLIETARRGAQHILQQALEAEIETHLEANRAKVDEDGHREVVRNVHAPDPEHESFTSGVLPRFLRRTPSVEGVVAVLYLKGISTNDFETALRAIYGEKAASLSAITVSRLKDVRRLRIAGLIHKTLDSAPGARRTGADERGSR